MRHILGARSAAVLARAVRARVLVAFDFDGTLAPLVDDRARAAMRARTRRLLAAVCGAYPCAVISGRSRGDVSSRLRGVGVKYVVGNHGLEPGAASAATAATSRASVRRCSAPSAGRPASRSRTSATP